MSKEHRPLDRARANPEQVLNGDGLSEPGVTYIGLGARSALSDPRELIQTTATGK